MPCSPNSSLLLAQDASVFWAKFDALISCL